MTRAKKIKAWAVADLRRTAIPYGSSCPSKRGEHDAEGFMAICEEKLGAETALLQHRVFYKGCSVVPVLITIVRSNKSKSKKK
jgi:hypothetical protein